MDLLRRCRGGSRSHYYLAGAGIFLLFSPTAFAQLPTCTIGGVQNVVHAEGFAEPMGNITLTCAGGAVGTTVAPILYISLNTNVTNRLDVNGNPLGITATLNTGAGATPINTVSASLTSATNLNVSGVPYTVTAATAVITVSGILANAAALTVPAGITPIIASITVEANGFLIANGSPTIGKGSPSLLASVINRGVPCKGSSLPLGADFLSFVANAPSSTIRLTEATASAFSVKTPGADTGFRIIVNFSGYGSGAQLYVPGTLVGSTGAQPTSDGSFGLAASAGSYTGPGQLLLILITGADATGAGGSRVAVQQPSVAMFGLTMTNGSAYAVYEVADSNPAIVESAQLPIFVVAPITSCASPLIPQYSEMPAPVSTVSTASATAPIPRFTATPAPSDCTEVGDCPASYYPALSVSQTAIVLNGLSQGVAQTAVLLVANAGSGILPFTASIAYQSGSGWLSVTPSSGAPASQPAAQVQVVANPGQLAQGTYTATLTISSGNYGTAAIAVTFTVGPVGVTIQNVGNAASYLYGTVAPGSYAVIFGADLAGQNVFVTFNSLLANIIYSNATQINLIVPPQLGAMQSANVVVTVNGNPSNTFQVSLAPNSPGIFTPGIVNLDNAAINGPGQPVTRGRNISVFLTGLSNPLTGQVTVNIGNQTNLIPLYAGTQPTYPALDQVNVTVPASLPPAITQLLQVCIPGPSGQAVCSNQVYLYVQ